MIIAVMQKGEPMSEGAELLIELIFLVVMVIFVFTEADIRFIIEAATLYLAAVIRHTGRKEKENE